MNNLCCLVYMRFIVTDTLIQSLFYPVMGSQSSKQFFGGGATGFFGGLDILQWLGILAKGKYGL